MKPLKALVLLVALIALAGCATLTQPKVPTDLAAAQAKCEKIVREKSGWYTNGVTSGQPTTVTLTLSKYWGMSMGKRMYMVRIKSDGIANQIAYYMDGSLAWFGISDGPGADTDKTGIEAEAPICLVYAHPRGPYGETFDTPKVLYWEP